MLKRVKTPCVGVCSTGIGDEVCRGCKRFEHEVIDWNAYSEVQRQLIAERLEGFLCQVVANKIDIVDQALLLSQIKHQQIAFNEQQSPYCWIFALLKAGASQISAGDYGLQVSLNWRNQTLPQIKAAIDKDYYALSCAHYDRYFSAGHDKYAAVNNKTHSPK